MYKETIKTAGSKMDKTIAVIQKDLSPLRAGRANPQILDRITVDYYGSPTALNQVRSSSCHCTEKYYGKSQNGSYAG